MEGEKSSRKMISDSNLEYAPQWATIANVGIGGPVPYVPPSMYTITPASPSEEWMKVLIVGSSYTDMMAYLHRPLVPWFDPAAVYVSFQFEMMTDALAPMQAQAIEFENCFCVDGEHYYNGSLQINYQQGGELQAWAGPNNQWANTGINLGILVPSTPYRFKVLYLLNTVEHTLSTISVSVNDIVHSLPSEFQNIPAIIKNPAWAEGVYVQFQLDLAHAGGQFSIFAKNVSVNWE